MSFGSFGSSTGFGQQQNNSGGFGASTSTFGASNNNASGGFSFGGGGGNTGGFGATNNQPQQQGGFGGGGFGGNTTTFGQPAQPQQSGGMFGGGAAGGGGLTNPNNDFEIPRDQNSAQDSYSCLSWTPMQNSNLMICGSWDNKLRCYNVQTSGMQIKADLQAFIDHTAPVLDCCFKHDGTGCFSVGCSNTVKYWQFAASSGQQQAQDVGRHDAPIKCVRWIKENNLLATAGWDNKLCYWDLRSPQPTLTLQLPGRADCMDIKMPYAVVGTGGSEQDRQVLIYNLQANPNQPERVLNQLGSSNSVNTANTKPLKKQYRSIAIFPDVAGFAISSIEGRCSIQYFAANRIASNFAFKCHRDKTNKLIYPVNSLAFHNQWGTFATAGGDGMWNFWDKDSKQRLKASTNAVTYQGQQEPVAVTCSGFNSNGDLFAYGISYDWGKGASFNRPNSSSLYIHNTPEAEIKPKKSSSSNRRY
uniref:Uncharacterized protein n=1 Tax=Mucochytrium quahogii TaxID=96639 RepID=A0A7S2W704_9STRA|mmetsp:Transcript_5174/g.7888  ORF Transcript_5174/g.7888 Transcript_5174/m.7888 type:complete len:473 (+) Transcript_5174:261-1679(+)|eukprot:CAMPEP_0203754892 /NCGR_PEP_ID=MMETSP0098-20131031/8441_1 /ASSEMBLY_ACC=CAM_ASM_000208 /TAXON_ID=96639 /ORGANISM=" , Strain NY0313808BC1" /LENGTH=472 /DNA_ID=CAMNT_0050646127 /DNA_START=178 /DNA_END=1596 /DNA_ORIENTATION=+